MPSSPPHSLQQHPPSSSPSAPDTTYPAPPRYSHANAVDPGLRRPQIMDGRAAFSQSSPDLGHRLHGAPHSSAEPPRAAASIHTPPTHSIAPSDDAYGRQTWMDFLRDAGADQSALVQPPYPLPHAPQHPNLHAPLPPLPVDASQHQSSQYPSFPAPASASTEDLLSRSSLDRKRRLTTADSPFRRPSSIRMHSEDQPGSSSSNPLVLGSSPVAPGPSHPSIPPRINTGRRESDFVLPRWQPDSEVTHCFVCGSHFTFFYRKHHCRKCGRVVCSACSPHRITIPRQYIVHPPYENPNISDLTSEDDGGHMARFGPFGNPALGGGEEVRVCNPCVPDPNYSPPPQHGGASPFPPFSPTPLSPHLPPSNVLPRGPRPSHRSTQSVNDSTRTVSHGQAPRSRELLVDRRTSYHANPRMAAPWPPAQESSQGYSQPRSYDHRNRPHSRSLHTSNPPPDTGNLPGSSMPGPRRFFASGPPAPAPPPQPQPTPRRQIAEEDECPVCGNELPAKDPDGDEAARIQHVEECIALHSGSPPPAAATPADLSSTSLPSQRTRGMSSAAGNGEGSSNRMSMMARGMVPYVATEKDCVDEEGAEAECVICFEEFEAGDKMARLVCWCKFHEKCIRDWWAKKGRGACPTHQLQY